jgi:hypothetical protein
LFGCPMATIRAISRSRGLSEIWDISRWLCRTSRQPDFPRTLPNHRDRSHNCHFRASCRHRRPLLHLSARKDRPLSCRQETEGAFPCGCGEAFGRRRCVQTLPV